MTEWLFLLRTDGLSSRTEKPNSATGDSSEILRAGRHVEKEAWYQAEGQIDVAYGLG